jgi:HTH-type transcriptional regulator, sugar sensing transcriptional regulator
MAIMDAALLESLGLTQNESKVYLALLELGETKTGPIVKKTHMHRVLIYDSLESLKQKGLTSFVIKQNIKFFQASDPKRLVEFIEEKKAQAQQILPELEILQKTASSHQTVSVYEGLVGLKSAMNNMLKELSPGGTHYVFASGNMAPTMGPYYDLYQKIKKNNKIKTYVLYDFSFKKQKPIIDRTTAQEIRFFEFQTFPTDTWIYNDKVLIVTYTASPPVAILIESKETAQSYKRMFDGFWARGEKYK